MFSIIIRFCNFGTVIHDQQYINILHNCMNIDYYLIII